MKKHELNTHPIMWDAIKAEKKTFEVRRNDRFFQTGDIVVLIKMDETERFYDVIGDSKTQELTFKVGFILHGPAFGIEPGYCAFQLEKP